MTQAPSSPAPRRDRIRARLAVVLVVLSSLLVIVSTVAVWAHRTAFDTDGFMSTVEPALDDPALYAALSDTVAEQALDVLDLDNRVADRLTELDESLAAGLMSAIPQDGRASQLLDRLDRPTLAVLGPPIAARVEERVQQVVDELITSKVFRERLPVLIRRAHHASVTLIRSDVSDLPNVYVADGEVRLNLIPVIADALRPVLQEFGEFLPDVELPDVVSERASEGRQQLAQALRTQVPDDFGQVTLMSEDSLLLAQQTVQRVDRNLWAVLVITLAVIIATVAISPTTRRTLAQLAVGVAIGMILGAVLIRRLESSFLEAEQGSGRDAVGIVLTATTSSLNAVVLLVGAAALIGALVAYLAGRPAWVERSAGRTAGVVSRARASDELDRWVAAHADALRLGALVVGTILVVATGFRPIPLLLVAIAVMGFLWAVAVAVRRAAVTATPAAVNTPKENDGRV